MKVYDRALSDAEDDKILEIRDSLLASQGGEFNELEFGRAVAAAQREACAQLCDEEASCEGIAQRCAEKIRGIMK